MDLSENPRLLKLYQMFFLQLGLLNKDLAFKTSQLRNVPSTTLARIEERVNENIARFAYTAKTAFEEFLRQNDIPELCLKLEKEELENRILLMAELDPQSVNLLKGVLESKGARLPQSKASIETFIRQADSDIARLEASTRALREHRAELFDKIETKKHELTNK